jgi:hypothetical protein
LCRHGAKALTAELKRNKNRDRALSTIQMKQLEISMRNGFYIAAAAVLLMATPAVAGELRAQSTELSSQGVVLEGPGVGVRVGPGVRDRGYNRDRDNDRGRHRGWRDREVRGEGCKTVTVKERAPNGAMVTRTRSNC